MSKLLKIDFQSNIFLNEVLVNFRLTKEMPPKTGFIHLAIVLEMLFNEDKHRDVKFWIAKRVALLLTKEPKQAVKIFNDIYSLFGIRKNDIVHGKKLIA